METRRGFITIATGNERYYRMAHNLLLSYRLHAKIKNPFAILCDRENEWTADFDRVVIVENPTRSFCDKLRILDLAPFEETIFIDADSLVYRDPDVLWEYFKDGPDVGVVGAVFPLGSEEGWWEADNLGELKEKVRYMMKCQGGIYFVRQNGKDLPAFMETCRYIREHYFEYHFRMGEKVLMDETIMSLASCVHQYLPVKHWTEVFAYYPYAIFRAMDILSGELEFDWTEFPERRYRDSLLIHFGTYAAMNRWAYKREVFHLKRGPLRLSNLWEYSLLLITHAWHKLIMTFYRFFDKKRECTMDIYA